MSTLTFRKRYPVLQRLWDWPSVLLLLAALLTTTQRLVTTEWTENLEVVMTITVFGAIAGLAFGYSCYGGWMVSLCSLVYGVFFIGWRLGRIFGQGVQWQERIFSLQGRLGISFSQLAAQQEVPDPLLFLVAICVLFWLLSFTAGFSLVRGARPWLAIIPAGITLVLIHTYDPYFRIRMWPLAFYLLFGLGLVARLNYLRLRAGWKLDNVRTPFYTGLDMMRMTLGAVALLVLLAWAAPALASSLAPAEEFWRKLTEPWRGVQEDIQRAFSSLHPSTSDSIDYYGAALSLGRGTPLGDKEVLRIVTEGRPQPTTRFSWRARVYDYFDPYDKGWQSTYTDVTEVRPDRFDLKLPAYTGRLEADFSVHTLSSLSILYVAPQPVWVSRSAQIGYVNIDEDFSDIGYIRVTRTIQPGEKYEFKSSISDVSVAQLRKAGDDYPDWVLERYLQMPSSTTQRTIDLAKQIADEEATPYDITWAITEYLRDEIEWVETLPQIPVEKDPVDWVLFDLKQGFCNYTATAEIIMLRSLGIPARLGAGYAQGEVAFDEEQLQELERQGFEPGQLDRIWGLTTTYIVRQRDLHAWPEVFFPGIGWVEFEPSANQEPLVRPIEITTEFSANNAGGTLTPEEEIARARQQQDQHREDNDPAEADHFFFTSAGRLLLLILSVLMMLTVAGWRILRNRGLQPLPVLVEKGLRKVHLHPPPALQRWSHRSRLTAIEKAYLEINQALKSLDHPASLQATPLERAYSLGNLLPSLMPAAFLLCQEYQNAVYGQKQANLQAAADAARMIRKRVRLVKLNRYSAGLIKVNNI